jgi:hypothetical protein
MADNKVGRPRIFESPEELEMAWVLYKESLKEKAKEWPIIQYVGKNGERVEDYPKLPLVLEGFYVWGHDHYGTIKEYFLNREGRYDDFSTICTRIRDEIREDQITGGLLGKYNPSITQRLNGLTDKQEHQIHVEQPLFPPQ